MRLDNTKSESAARESITGQARRNPTCPAQTSQLYLGQPQGYVEIVHGSSCGWIGRSYPVTVEYNDPVVGVLFQRSKTGSLEIRHGGLIGSGLTGRAHLERGGPGLACMLPYGNFGAGARSGESNCNLYFPENVFATQNGSVVSGGNQGRTFQHYFEYGYNFTSPGVASVGPTWLIYFGIPPTPTPTDTPTPTPIPSWGEDGITRIAFGAPIPDFEEQYDHCIRNGTVEMRLPCAVDAFNQYKSQLPNGQMTWGQFVALVMYSEGGLILQNNPQSSGLGVCWRRAGGDWHDGPTECFVPTVPSAPGLQGDFPYAVWEWLFHECSIATGFVNYQNYHGECNESGLSRFLSQVQTFYTASTYNPANANVFLSLAQTEFDKWGSPDAISVSGGRYQYGVCPCTWGNVAYELPEQVPPGQDPEYESARRNDNKNWINGGWSFSYFAWDPIYAPVPAFRYFKVY